MIKGIKRALIYGLIMFTSVSCGSIKKVEDTKGTALDTKNMVTIPKASKAKIVEEKPDKLLNISLEDENGKKLNLTDFTTGKPTILVFYTSWCGDCRQMVPKLNEFAKKDKDVAFVFINAVDNTRETKKSGRQYVKDSKYFFQYLMASANDTIKIYNLKKIPLVMGFDKNGNRIDYLIESFTEDEIATLINNIKK